MNKFRNKTNNRMYSALFYERVLADKSTVVYTLKDQDHEGPDGTKYPSLYRLYMESKDPTEYRFAVDYLDGWEHWENLCSAKWFQPFVKRWRRELEVRLRSEALNEIVKDASDPQNKNHYSANKLLLERGWVPSDSKGRPSKTEIQKAAKEQAQEDQLILDAWKKLESIDDRTDAN